MIRPIEFEGYEFYGVTHDGYVYNNKTGRQLKFDMNNCGYRRVTLYTPELGRKRIAVHRLVAMHFVPNPFDKPMVNHINGNKTNNNCSNLEWVTCKENTRHAFDTGLRSAWNKLPQEEIDLIRKMKVDGFSRYEIAAELGIKASRVSDVLYRKCTYK